MVCCPAYPNRRRSRWARTRLRALPWDRLPLFRLTDPRLATTLGGVSLPNPLILAAMYYDPRILRRAMGSASARSRPSRSRASAARSPAAEPGAVEIGGRAGTGQLQRLPEPRARRVRRVDRVAAPSRATDRERGRRVGRGLRGARGDARSARRSRRGEHLLAEHRLVYAWNERPQALREVLGRWVACRRGR